MRRKNNQGSIITLLIVIVAIVVLHVLRDLREDDNGNDRSDEAALTWDISRY
jgi:hypothetical protein